MEAASIFRDTGAQIWIWRGMGMVRHEESEALRRATDTRRGGGEGVWV